MISNEMLCKNFPRKMPDHPDARFSVVFNDTMRALHYAWTCEKLTWREHFEKNFSLPSSIMILFLVIALGLTVLRASLSRYAFKPLARWLGLSPQNVDKLPESAFKFIFYLTMSALEFEAACVDHDFWQRPLHLWRGVRLNAPVEPKLHFIYVCQIGFYIHMLYATMYMDDKRKDTGAMMFHHVLTLSLTIFSYAFRLIHIGVLILFIHDVNDWLLEFTKLNVYVKVRAGVTHYVHELLSSVGFVVFAASWASTRLYFYPLKVLHANLYGMFVSGEREMRPAPLWLFFNVQLWVLQLLNIWWFWFIIAFLWRVATGQLSAVEDIRELEDEDTAEDTSRESNGDAMVDTNGRLEPNEDDDTDMNETRSYKEGVHNGNVTNGNLTNGHVPDEAKKDK